MTINRYELPQIQQAYFARCAYNQRTEKIETDYLVQWPKDLYSGQFSRDTGLLQESFTASTTNHADLPSRVFGNQLRHERMSAQHLANLLYERATLYTRHITDIKSRRSQMQEALPIDKLLSPREATRHQMALEKMLVQLESDRRKEELDFWKDTQDIREGLFDKAWAYRTNKERVNLLGSFGGHDAGGQA